MELTWTDVVFIRIAMILFYVQKTKVLGMERIFVRFFYINKENFWSQESPEGGTWVGTTHQGASAPRRA